MDLLLIIWSRISSIAVVGGNVLGVNLLLIIWSRIRTIIVGNVLWVDLLLIIRSLITSLAVGIDDVDLDRRTEDSEVGGRVKVGVCLASLIVRLEANSGSSVDE